MAEKRWAKDDILPPIDSPAYKKLLDELEKNVASVEAQRAKLHPSLSGHAFLTIIKTKERIAQISSRLGDYAYLWYSENTADQHAKQFMSTIEQLGAAIDNRIMFVSLWFKDLDNTNAERLIRSVPGEYHYLLQYLRLLKKHTLTEPEEKVINLKDTTGLSALIKLYDMVTTDLTFTLTVDGTKKELTREELAQHVKDHRAPIRKAAYQELYRVYGSHSDILNELYRNVVLDWKNESITLRNYPDPISVRNKGNDISDKAIHTLLDVCKKHAPLFQEYFTLKARLCNIKKMSRYDLYAPYKEKKKTYTYDQALSLVFDAYAAYSPEMANLAKNLVITNHVDYTVMKNKMTGAYCLDVGPGYTPYVLLNFLGDIRDVFTIAHEFGHGVHDQLTHDHSILTASPPLILAETASIFGEMLLFDSLMQKTNDKELKKTLLIQQLDNIYASVMRQAYFVLYEITAHDLIAKGTDLTTLTKAYLANLREQFGPTMTIPEEFQYEWTSIPHIYHSPFYCYAYAFGNLLVLSLYERYRKEGKRFVPKYLKILAYGGSEKPEKILKEIGIDVEDPHFWQGGFTLINDMIKELKALSK